METLKIGVISDLHLFAKTIHLERAFSALQGIRLLLMIGDMADRATAEQYDLLSQTIAIYMPDVPVYCVSGNHDNPARDDTLYRAFERRINKEYPTILDDCGAFYKVIQDEIDLIGLNPVYHQKQFFFTEKGRQLAFLQEKLRASVYPYHIVMCHPPLIAHNPQRTADMASYITPEQDKRLQRILDENRRVIFLSGHTHVSPTVEWDEVHGNLYINDGSLCPTTVRKAEHETQQGNVTLLNISEEEISVIVKGLDGHTVFCESSYKL